MTDNKSSLAVSVELDNASFRARVDDRRRETREMFKGLSAEERNALAGKAWSAGIRVLSSRHGSERSTDEPRKSTRLSTIPPSRW